MVGMRWKSRSEVGIRGSNDRRGGRLKVRSWSERSGVMSKRMLGQIRSLLDGELGSDRFGI